MNIYISTHSKLDLRYAVWIVEIATDDFGTMTDLVAFYLGVGQ